MGYKRVVAVEMEDDWYVIPIELKTEFNDLENDIIDASCEELGDRYYELLKEFEDKFGEYAVGGDLNLTELYIKDGK